MLPSPKLYVLLPAAGSATTATAFIVGAALSDVIFVSAGIVYALLPPKIPVTSILCPLEEL